MAFSLRPVVSAGYLRSFVRSLLSLLPLVCLPVCDLHAYSGGTGTSTDPYIMSYGDWPLLGGYYTLNTTIDWTAGGTAFSLYDGDTNATNVEVTSNGNLTCKDVYLGYYSGDGGWLVLNGGHISTGTESVNRGNAYIGKNGQGVFTMSSGSFTEGCFFIGNESNGNGTFTVNAGTVTANDSVLVGVAGKGTMYMNGGTVTTTNTFRLATGTGSSGTLYMAGGTINAKTGFDIALASTADVTMTSGEIDAGTYFAVGSNTNGNTNGCTGTMEMSAGTVKNTGKTYIGYKSLGTGTLTLTGGTFTSSGATYVGNDSGSTGTLSLGGGTLNANGGLYVGNSGSGTLSLTLGTLSTTTFFAGAGTGSGTVTMSGGSITASSFCIGSTGSAAMTMTGGSVTCSGNFFVGEKTNSTLTMTGGSIACTGNAYIGSDASASPAGTGALALSGSGTEWSSTGTLSIGGGSTATATVSDGAILKAGGLTVKSSGSLVVNGSSLVVLDAAPTVTSGAIYLNSGWFAIKGNVALADLATTFGSGNGEIEILTSVVNKVNQYTDLSATNVTRTYYNTTGETTGTDYTTGDAVYDLFGSAVSLSGYTVIHVPVGLSSSIPVDITSGTYASDYTVDEAVAPYYRIEGSATFDGNLSVGTTHYGYLEITDTDNTDSTKVVAKVDGALSIGGGTVGQVTVDDGAGLNAGSLTLAGTGILTIDDGSIAVFGSGTKSGITGTGAAVTIASGGVIQLKGGWLAVKGTIALDDIVSQFGTSATGGTIRVYNETTAAYEAVTATNITLDYYDTGTSGVAYASGDPIYNAFHAAGIDLSGGYTVIRGGVAGYAYGLPVTVTSSLSTMDSGIVNWPFCYEATSSVDFGSTEVYFGSSAPNNRLTVSGGATLSCGEFYIGTSATSTGNNVTVKGSGTELSSADSLIVGNSGKGTFSVEDSALAYDAMGMVGYHSKGDAATVTRNATWLNLVCFMIGNSSHGTIVGNGTVAIEDGGLLMCGSNGGGTSGTDTLYLFSGSSLRLGEDGSLALYTGDSELSASDFFTAYSGKLQVPDGKGGYADAIDASSFVATYYDSSSSTTINGQSVAGYTVYTLATSGSNVFRPIDITSSNYTSHEPLDSATLPYYRIQGAVDYGSGNVSVGISTTGYLEITGSGAVTLIGDSNTLNIGGGTAGTVTLNNHAALAAGNVGVASSGVLTIADGCIAAFGSAAKSGITGTGAAVTIASGGVIQLKGGWLAVKGSLSLDALVAKFGASATGGTIRVYNETTSAYEDITEANASLDYYDNGTNGVPYDSGDPIYNAFHAAGIDLSGGYTVIRGGVAGYAYGATKSVTSSMITMDDGIAYWSFFYTAAGSVTFDSSATFYVGRNNPNNTLTIRNGAVVSNGAATIGSAAASIGNTVDVTGSDTEWACNGPLTVGGSGDGVLIIEHGALVTCGNSTFSGTSALYVGSRGAIWLGKGTLAIYGTVDASAFASGGVYFGLIQTSSDDGNWESATTAKIEVETGSGSLSGYTLVHTVGGNADAPTGVTSSDYAIDSGYMPYYQIPSSVDFGAHDVSVGASTEGNLSITGTGTVVRIGSGNMLTIGGGTTGGAIDDGAGLTAGGITVAGNGVLTIADGCIAAFGGTAKSGITGTGAAVTIASGGVIQLKGGWLAVKGDIALADIVSQFGASATGGTIQVYNETTAAYESVTATNVTLEYYDDGANGVAYATGDPIYDVYKANGIGLSSGYTVIRGGVTGYASGATKTVTTSTTAMDVGIVNWPFYFTATGTVTFGASTQVFVGSDKPDNLLTLSEDATVSNGAATIGSAAASTGNEVHVADGATWTCNGTLTVGASGGGTLIVGNGALVECGNSSFSGTNALVIGPKGIVELAANSTLAIYGDFSAGSFYSNYFGRIAVPAGASGYKMATSADQFSAQHMNSGAWRGYTIIGVVSVPEKISLSTSSIYEGASAIYAVTMNYTTTEATELEFNVGGDTSSISQITFSNSVSYYAAGNTITVPAGVDSFTITVATTDDSIYEGARDFTLDVGGTSATCTILDNDSAQKLNGLSSSSCTEGGSIVHNVTFTASSTAIRYGLYFSGDTDAISQITFSNGVSYDTANGTITIPANITGFNITISTSDDLVYEGTRAFTLRVGDNSVTDTVLDNDAAPVVSSITAGSLREGDTLNQTVTLNRTASSELTYTVQITSAKYSFFSVAVNYGGGDFDVPLNSANSGTITVPANTSSFTIKVTVRDDSIHEGDGTYTLNVGGVASNAVSVSDKESKQTVASVGSPSVTEGGNVVHTVTLSGEADTALVYPLTLGASGDTATIGTDTGTVSTLLFSNGVAFYDATDTAISIPAGVTSFTVTVPTVGDHVKESTETYTLTIGETKGKGTLIDLTGYTADNPRAISSSNFASILPLDAGSATQTFYYEIADSLSLGANDLVVGNTTAGNQLVISDALVTIAPGYDLTLGKGESASGTITVENDAILHVGGDLVVGKLGAGILNINAGSLVMVDGTASTGDNGDIRLAIGSDSKSGYLALKGRFTTAQVLASLKIHLSDGSDLSAADASNLLVVYLDGKTLTYADLYLHNLFGDDVDLDGCTIVTYSPLNLAWTGQTGGTDFWFCGTWYGWLYYQPDYGCNFWSEIQGWQYSNPVNTSAAAYFWDYGTNSWWYTNITDYPEIFRYSYDAGSATWGGSWYAYKSGCAPDRVFHDRTNDRDVNEADLPDPGY
jgi:T5SS/PEP-CTERM-associated repeat protein